MKKINVLFLAANAIATKPLRLDEELRVINEKIRASEYRDLLHLVSFWAVRPDDLLQSFNEHEPTIVHFSGHGSAIGEIILLNNVGNPQPVSKDALRSLFKTLKKKIRVVILNACYSHSQAEAIAEIIDCVIGMDAAIGDRAATVFASSFYRAIGFGLSVKDAFEQGRVALQLEGIPEENTPDLICRPSVKPSKVFLLDKPKRSLGLVLSPTPYQPVKQAQQNTDQIQSTTHSWVEVPTEYLPRDGMARRIINALDNRRCATLHSSAGTGKSVLVAQIARILHDKCIFYRFQATERDTAPFLAWIAEQFEVYFPNHSDQFKTIRNLLRQGLGNQEVIANLIGKIMQQEQITQTIYVIIDDYHYITQDSRVQIEFDKILMVLIGQTPYFLKFIIASRTELPNYAEDTIVFKNVGLKKGEAKKLVAKLDLSISNKTMEFLYTALNGYFLAWRAILDLKKKLSLTENDIMSLLSESNEAFHE